ncbi:Conserved_hypothetical protein [Hexamita inflata]|uniref:Uncharacterized protein n=1 Tax=Hexamita inflata TaxID=28002 RepID=A0AA86V4D0_9EUKA|nr:Conserved hypothetical protein [Hexamita inflata]
METKPSLFILKDVQKIFIRSGKYNAFIDMKDTEQLNKLEQNNVLALKFVDKESEAFFGKHNQLEIDQEEMVFVIQQILLNDFDSIIDYYIFEKQYLVPVEGQLASLVKEAESELK